MRGTSEMNNDYLPEPPLGVFTVEIATRVAAAPIGAHFLRRSYRWPNTPGRSSSDSTSRRKSSNSPPTATRIPVRPGIILIDPQLMTIPGGRTALEAAAAGLPKWILPMLIVDQPDDARTEDLADQVRDILSAVDALRARSARSGARGVSSLRAFSLLVRDMVFEAEGQYIAHRSRQRYGARYHRVRRAVD